MESYKKQNDLNLKNAKQQIQKLTAQLIEKQNLLKRQIIENKITLNDENQQKELEKKYADQEQLLNGYQTENERLYNELKQTKEYLKLQHQQNDMDNQKLKIDIINKNIQIDNLKQQQVIQPRLAAETPPVQEESTGSSFVLQDRIRLLESEKITLLNNVDSLKQKLDKFEQNQMNTQLNSFKLVETQSAEIKALHEHVKMLEAKLNQQLKQNDNYKNLKKIRDDFEVRIGKLEMENEILRVALDEVCYFGFFFVIYSELYSVTSCKAWKQFSLFEI